MSQHENPFKRLRFSREIILMTVRRNCRNSLSCREVRDMLTERGVAVIASTILEGHFETCEIDFVAKLFPKAAWF